MIRIIIFCLSIWCSLEASLSASEQSDINALFAYCATQSSKIASCQSISLGPNPSGSGYVVTTTQATVQCLTSCSDPPTNLNNKCLSCVPNLTATESAFSGSPIKIYNDCTSCNVQVFFILGSRTAPPPTVIDCILATQTQVNTQAALCSSGQTAQISAATSSIVCENCGSECTQCNLSISSSTVFCTACKYTTQIIKNPSGSSTVPIQYCDIPTTADLNAKTCSAGQTQQVQNYQIICSSCKTNCTSCSGTSQICSACVGSTYVIQSDQTCAQPTQSQINSTSSCSSGSGKGVSNYALGCQTCGSNCATCLMTVVSSYALICSSCTQSSYIINSNQTTCSALTQTEVDTFLATCSTASQGAFFSNNQLSCQSCSATCNKCKYSVSSSVIICTICNQPSTEVTETNKPGCITPSQSEITTAESTISCAKGSGVGVLYSQIQCTPCDITCSVCHLVVSTGVMNCTVCLTNYEASSNPAECQKIDSTTARLGSYNCADGEGPTTYPTNEGGAIYCVACQDPSCKRCQKDTVNKTSQMLCQICYNSTYITSGIGCVPISQSSINNKSCPNGQGGIIIGNALSCEACGSNCKQCSYQLSLSIMLCQICMPNMINVQTYCTAVTQMSLQVYICQTGYTASLVGQALNCIKCPSFCESCTYQLATSTNQCNECQPYYINQSNVCTQITQAILDGQNICTSPQTEVLENGLISCANCPQGCSKCSYTISSTSFACSECYNPSSTVINGSCETTPMSNTNYIKMKQLYDTQLKVDKVLCNAMYSSFYDPIQNTITCKACPSGCEECRNIVQLSKQICLKSIQTQISQSYIQTVLNYKGCPQNQYPFQLEGIVNCKECRQVLAECNQCTPDINLHPQCTQCNQGYNIINGNCIQNLPNCVTNYIRLYYNGVITCENTKMSFFIYNGASPECSLQNGYIYYSFRNENENYIANLEGAEQLIRVQALDSNKHIIYQFTQYSSTLPMNISVSTPKLTATYSFGYECCLNYNFTNYCNPLTRFTTTSITSQTQSNISLYSTYSPISTQPLDLFALLYIQALNVNSIVAFLVQNVPFFTGSQSNFGVSCKNAIYSTQICNNQGACNNKTNINWIYRCNCNKGFFGLYCQFTESEQTYLMNQTNTILNQIQNLLSENNLNTNLQLTVPIGAALTLINLNNQQLMQIQSWIFSLIKQKNNIELLYKCLWLEQLFIKSHYTVAEAMPLAMLQLHFSKMKQIIQNLLPLTTIYNLNIITHYYLSLTELSQIYQINQQVVTLQLGNESISLDISKIKKVMSTNILMTLLDSTIILRNQYPYILWTYIQDDKEAVNINVVWNKQTNCKYLIIANMSWIPCSQQCTCPTNVPIGIFYYNPYPNTVFTFGGNQAETSSMPTLQPLKIRNPSSTATNNTQLAALIKVLQFYIMTLIIQY